MKIKKLLALILLLLSTLACGESTVSAAPTPACTATSPAVKLDAESRPFHMGFTRWPPEATLEGIDRMNNFVNTYGDMTALHFDGGVPWPEALTDSPLPAGLMSSWQFTRDAIPAEHTLLVSITPLDMTRSKLAAYWGESDNQPLPKPWDGYSLDHADVKTAYLNYARRVVEYFHPDYLAIGIEANVAQVNAPESWEAYKQLHQFVYENLKAEYPDLPIFATFTISHMSGLDGGDQATQKKEIETLLPYLDMLGLSAYPYGWMYESGKADPIPDDFFAPALAFGKPIGITESGAPSYDFSAYGKDYKFSEEYQARWIDFLMQKGIENHFEFAIAFTGIDYDKLIAGMPTDVRELATIWVYTGLQRSDGCDKFALSYWDAYLKLPFKK
ncbi:MAG TPA: hypothetical protein PKN81_12340 [Anaerolineales bacterium]|nr:hypothetical protein [Anaerolineales bacterium]HUM27012.1 hypothetical protein [Anaerolineales bacterium]